MTIEIVPHKAEWAREFAAIRAEIEGALGDGVISIDHIGSTSVPGLAAKGIIDLQLTVSDLDLPLREPLERFGFILGRPTQDHAPPGLELGVEDLSKRFYKNAVRRMNLHVRKRGAFNQRYALLFRDYLRATPLARDAYAEVKKILAQRFPDDVDGYYDIKDPVCDVIMAGAYQWASASNWQPDSRAR